VAISTLVIVYLIAGLVVFAVWRDQTRRDVEEAAELLEIYEEGQRLVAAEDRKPCRTGLMRSGSVFD
jgi:hypothetical protein